MWHWCLKQRAVLWDWGFHLCCMCQFQVIGVRVELNCREPCGPRRTEGGMLGERRSHIWEVLGVENRFPLGVLWVLTKARMALLEFPPHREDSREKQTGALYSHSKTRASHGSSEIQQNFHQMVWTQHVSIWSTTSFATFLYHIPHLGDKITVA